MGRLPRFPSGGTNRIRFKGYNLSRMAPPSKMLITKLQNAATPLQIYAKNPILCNTLIFRAEKDTPFTRRTVPRMLPRGIGTVFPRRQLHFSIPGGLGTVFPRRQLHFSIPGGLGTVFPRRRLHFSIPGGLGGHFLRRKLPQSIPGVFGTVFPRRRLQFFLPRRK